MDNVEIAYLADHADQVFALAAALHTEDREYYGARPPLPRPISRSRFSAKRCRWR
jgi:hypothetical protein